MIILIGVCNPDRLFGQDFRKCRWGETKAQVLNKEGKPFQSNGDELFYKNKLVGRYTNVMTYYSFHPRRNLVCGRYVFIDPDRAIIKEIGRALDRKYGAAKIEQGEYGFKQFHWSPKGTHITILYDDAGFMLNYYEQSYWEHLVKNEMKIRSEGL
jgi:hypothetical protein